MWTRRYCGHPAYTSLLRSRFCLVSQRSPSSLRARETTPPTTGSFAPGKFWRKSCEAGRRMGRRNFQIFLAPSALSSLLRRQNSHTRKNNSATYTGYISPCVSGQPKALRVTSLFFRTRTRRSLRRKYEVR